MISPQRLNISLTKISVQWNGWTALGRRDRNIPKILVIGAGVSSVGN